MVVVSAPGKVMLLGGYAVVERNRISLSVAIDKRCYAQVDANENHHEITSRQFNTSVKLNDAFEAIEGDANKLAFVIAALKTVITYLKSKNPTVGYVKIETFSDPTFSVTGGKSGLGSSSAITAAAVAALCVHFGMNLTRDVETIHKLAQYANSLASGKVGSGYDVAVACLGSGAYARYNPDLIKLDDITCIDKKWDYTFEKTNLAHLFTLVMGNFIGDSTDTREMVKLVNVQFKKEHTDKFSSMITHIDSEGRQCTFYLKQIEMIFKNNPLVYRKATLQPDSNELFKQFKKSFTTTRKITKELGVAAGAAIESDAATKLIEESEKHGAYVARLPGAGGLDSIIALCTTEQNASKLEQFWRNQNEFKLQTARLPIAKQALQIENSLPPQK